METLYEDEKYIVMRSNWSWFVRLKTGAYLGYCYSQNQWAKKYKSDPAIFLSKCLKREREACTRQIKTKEKEIELLRNRLREIAE